MGVWLCRCICVRLQLSQFPILLKVNVDIQLRDCTHKVRHNVEKSPMYVVVCVRACKKQWFNNKTSKYIMKTTQTHRRAQHSIGHIHIYTHTHEYTDPTLYSLTAAELSTSHTTTNWYQSMRCTYKTIKCCVCVFFFSHTSRVVFYLFSLVSWFAHLNCWHCPLNSPKLSNSNQHRQHKSQHQHNYLLEKKLTRLMTFLINTH